MKKLDSLIVLSFFILSACDEPGKGRSTEQAVSNPKQVSEITKKIEGITTDEVEDVDVYADVTFEDTEAGVLKTNFDIRVRDQVEIDIVDLKGKNISVVDQITFDQNNPIFNLRAVSPGDTALIQEIIAESTNRTIANNKSILGRIFNKLERDSKKFPKLYSSRHNGPKTFFKNMMNAIEKKKRSEFVMQLAELATFFDKHHVRQREDFIANFSHLFVTHEFPSEGCRQMYFNAILRSGEISIDCGQGGNA